MLRQLARTTTLVSVCVALAGCHQSTQPRLDMRSTVLTGNQVSGFELRESGAFTLYDALVRTRANYFRARGVSSILNVPRDDILVFSGGMLMGDLESLRAISPSDVRVVRRINAVETFHKYGRTVSIGGIELEFVNQ
jgi:hypothetical protein